MGLNYSSPAVQYNPILGGFHNISWGVTDRQPESFTQLTLGTAAATLTSAGKLMDVPGATKGVSKAIGGGSITGDAVKYAVQGLAGITTNLANEVQDVQRPSVPTETPFGEDNMFITFGKWRQMEADIKNLKLIHKYTPESLRAISDKHWGSGTENSDMFYNTYLNKGDFSSSTPAAAPSMTDTMATALQNHLLYPDSSTTQSPFVSTAISTPLISPSSVNFAGRYNPWLHQQAQAGVFFKS